MEPVIAATYSFKIRLSDVAGGFKLTPTLAAGDFKISTSSIASGALTNLTNLPAETPAGSGIVVITLTAAEMADGDPIVTWKDQTTPQEWIEGYSFIDTRPSLAAMSTAIADIPTSAESAEIQDIVDGFLDELVAAHLISGSVGAGIASSATVAGLVATLTTYLTEYFQLALLDGAHVPTDLADALSRINANTGTGTGTYANTTSSQEAIAAGGGGGGASAEAIADEVETRALILHADYNAAKTAASQTSVNAVIAQTDQLNFTETGQVDANIQYINDEPLTGDGSESNKFGVS